MAAAIPPHPYYPIDALIAGYSPNEASVITLLIVASVSSLVLLGTTWTLVSLAKSSLRHGDRFAILWFVLCMFGLFACNHTWLIGCSWKPSLFLRRVFYLQS